MMEVKHDSEIGESLAMFRQLLEHIVKAIVNKPDYVRVNASLQPDGRHTLTIVVDEQDFGKVIGKNGQTIKAIRALVNALNPGRRDIIVDISK